MSMYQLEKHKYLFIYDTTNIKFIEYIFYNSILLDVVPIFINQYDVCILNYYKYNIDKLNICIIKSLPDNITNIQKLFPYNETIIKQTKLKNELINSHINNTQIDINNGITFTITTCKRYDKFIHFIFISVKSFIRVFSCSCMPVKSMGINI